MCLAKFYRECDIVCSVVYVWRRREKEARLTTYVTPQGSHRCRCLSRTVCGVRGIGASEKSEGKSRSEYVPRNICREPPLNFRRRTCAKERNNAGTFFVCIIYPFFYRYENHLARLCPFDHFLSCYFRSVGRHRIENSFCRRLSASSCGHRRSWTSSSSCHRLRRTLSFVVLLDPDLDEVSDLFRGDEKKKKEVEESGKVVVRKKWNRQ